MGERGEVKIPLIPKLPLFFVKWFSLLRLVILLRRGNISLGGEGVALAR